MTKELRDVMKEYAVNFEKDGIEFDATVKVNTDEFDMCEADVTVESIESDSDMELYEWSDVEEYIIEHWEEFEEVEGGGGGGG
jgi:hypothetical protein